MKQPNNNLYYQKHALDKGLEKYVKYAWVMKSEESKSKADLLIPDGYPEIIFVQKGAYHKKFLPPNPKTIVVKNSCIIGIQTQTVLASRMNQCQLLGVKLKPPGAYLLFGDRLKSLLDANVPLDRFGMEWLCDLEHRLSTCKTEIDKIKLLSETLLYQIEQSANKANSQLATSFLETILNTKGQIGIEALAQQHCLSVRHFQRKFKIFFGLSPKKFLNIIRFKHLYKSSILQQKIPSNFLDYGYYDQMHFIKDFRKHLGVNPSKSSDPIFLQLNQMAQRNR